MFWISDNHWKVKFICNLMAKYATYIIVERFIERIILNFTTLFSSKQHFLKISFIVLSP